MSLKGNLDTFTLTEILGLITETRKTGALHIRAVEYSGDLYFAGGRFCAGESGELSGPINPPEELIDRMTEVCFGLFRLERGDFEFEPGVLPAYQVPAAIDVEPVVEVVETRLRDIYAIELLIPSLEAVPRLAADISADAVSLDRASWRVLIAIDGQRSVRDMARSLGRSVLEICQVLKTLIEAGAITVLEEAPAPIPSLSNQAPNSHPETMTDAPLDPAIAHLAASMAAPSATQSAFAAPPMSAPQFAQPPMASPSIAQPPVVQPSIAQPPVVQPLAPTPTFAAPSIPAAVGYAASPIAVSPIASPPNLIPSSLAPSVPVFALPSQPAPTGYAAAPSMAPPVFAQPPMTQPPITQSPIIAAPPNVQPPIIAAPLVAPTPSIAPAPPGVPTAAAPPVNLTPPGPALTAPGAPAPIAYAATPTAPPVPFGPLPEMPAPTPAPGAESETPVRKRPGPAAANRGAMLRVFSGLQD